MSNVEDETPIVDGGDTDPVAEYTEILAVYEATITVRRRPDAINVVPITLSDLEHRVEGILIDAWGDGGVSVNVRANRTDE